MRPAQEGEIMPVRSIRCVGLLLLIASLVAALSEHAAQNKIAADIPMAVARFIFISFPYAI